MKNIIIPFALGIIALSACVKTENSTVVNTETAAPKTDTLNDIAGTLIKFQDMHSQFVDERNVEIWLPPSYARDGNTRYPVIYMHDGQVLFERGRGFSSQEWEVDEWMTRLISEGKVKEAIIVAPWNSPKRFREYQPSKPFLKMSEADQAMRDSLDQEYNGGPLADEYLRYIVEELKPYIDSTYRTHTNKQNTYMMGSSMGGLISIYAIAEYPHVFQKVACLSTHFPVSLRVNEPRISNYIISYLKDNLPDGSDNAIYFDYGTLTLDSWYAPHQKRMDSAMVVLGYDVGRNWVTRQFVGAEHSEVSWRERLDVPLAFLIGNE